MNRRVILLFLVVVVAFIQGGCTKLGVVNALLPQDDATATVIKGVAFGEHERQKLDVYIPNAVAESNYIRLPVVMFIYGGSWNDGRRQDYEFVGRALNASGFVAVLPDYQLVPEIRYPEFVLDGARALRWVHDNIAAYGGDPERLFLAGHSAGAYNAVMLTMADELLAEHSLPVPPVLGFAGLAGPYDFLPLGSRATKAAFRDVTDLEVTQPVNLITASTPPLLLIHGTDDDLVWIKHSRALHAAADRVGSTSTLKEYEGIGHIKLLLSLSTAFRNDAPTLNDMVAFFNAILAGQP